MVYLKVIVIVHNNYYKYYKYTQTSRSLNCLFSWGYLICILYSVYMLYEKYKYVQNYNITKCIFYFNKSIL